MSWRRWKRGLLVAGLTGLLTGFVVIGDLPWQKMLTLLAVTVAKDMLLFLRQAPPVTALSDETTVFVKKSEVDPQI
jgi:hypothetical protein